MIEKTKSKLEEFDSPFTVHMKLSTLLKAIPKTKLKVQKNKKRREFDSKES